MVLCSAFLRIPAGPNGNTGAGLLHTIWLWRNQAQFSNPLRDIQQPTETNLREAGLIPLDIDTKEREYANISRQDTQNSLDKPFFRNPTLLGTIHGALQFCIPVLNRHPHSLVFSHRAFDNVHTTPHPTGCGLSHPIGVRRV